MSDNPAVFAYYEGKTTKELEKLRLLYMELTTTQLLWDTASRALGFINKTLADRAEVI